MAAGKIYLNIEHINWYRQFDGIGYTVLSFPRMLGTSISHSKLGATKECHRDLLYQVNGCTRLRANAIFPQAQ